MKTRKLMYLLALVLISVLMLGNTGITTDGPEDLPPDPLADLRATCLGGVAFTEAGKDSGIVGFVGRELDAPIPKLSTMSAFADPGTAGMDYLAECGPVFGLDNASQDLQMLKHTTTEDGRQVLRYQQTYRGVEVFGGQLVMQLTKGNEILMVNSDVALDLDMDVTPAIKRTSARQTAFDLIADQYEISGEGLETTEPELLIYAPEVLGLEGDPVLVWQVTVEKQTGEMIKHLVFVSAKDGSIAFNINQLTNAKDLATYDMNNGTSYAGATLVCTEANPTCSGGDTHEVNAHIYAGDTYDFYSSYHSRDSIDGAGMQLKSYVHYSSGYCNAFWNGAVMTYGDGCMLTVDDVVAHEMTHGVTSYTSALIYSYQSGAINESFSDTWGEWVDLTNGSGNDTAGVRWAMGEDTSVGAARDMKDPTLYSDPDKMSSPYYYTGSLDNGGVHTNSGVGNKAAYLITDGDTFNGYTIYGIGIDKAAKIYYEAQTNILTSGAQYADLGNALVQACENLKGTVTANFHCNQVQKAVWATEMTVPVPAAKIPNKPVNDRSPKFYWSKVPNAQTYELQGHKDGSVYFTTMGPAGGFTCGASNCLYDYTGIILLPYSDNWEWRIRVEVEGIWGDYSPLTAFSVVPPELKSPKYDTSDTTPTFIWGIEKDATHYRLQAIQGSTILYTYTMNYTACGAANCLFTPPDVLSVGSTYRWRVQAKAGGVFGDWTPQQQFAVITDPSFVSNFTNSWDDWGIVNGDWSISYGSYLYTAGNVDELVSVYYKGSNFSDVRYQAAMKRPASGCATCANALYIRGVPNPLGLPDLTWNSGYYFTYTNGGYMSVWRLDSGVWVPLQGWTTTTTVNSGDWNILKVDADGNMLKFYINDTLVWSGTDSTYGTGKLGITMYSHGSDNFFVDWASASYLNTFMSMDEEIEPGQVVVEGGTPFMSP